MIQDIVEKIHYLLVIAYYALLQMIIHLKKIKYTIVF